MIAAPAAMAKTPDADGSGTVNEVERPLHAAHVLRQRVRIGVVVGD